MINVFVYYTYRPLYIPGKHEKKLSCWGWDRNKQQTLLIRTLLCRNFFDIERALRFSVGNLVMEICPCNEEKDQFLELFNVTEV